MDLSNKNKTVILAGGLGKRLQSVVSNVPKPMAPINERPFLDYVLSYWADYTSEFILSVGYKYEVIQTHFGDIYRDIPIRYVIEDKPLGTGGALLKVLNEIDINSSFFLLNGDTYFQIEIDRLMDHHKQLNADISMVLRKMSGADRYHKISINKQNKIISIEESNGREEVYINGGIYLVNPDAFKQYSVRVNHAVSLENEIFPELVSEMNVFGLPMECNFIDIGIPQDYQKAQQYFSNKTNLNLEFSES